MTGPDATFPLQSSAQSLAAIPANSAIFAGRIDFLYLLGRHHLYLPFSALCIVAVLYTDIIPLWMAGIPFVLQIAATIGTGRLAEAYMRRSPGDDPKLWAHRYTLASAASGAAWGVGAVIWFVPRQFPAEAFLSLAFLGMTAAEFIARSVYRPAYLAHAACSLVPLALMLLLQGDTYCTLSSLLVLFFGGVLYSYCESLSAILDDALGLRRENADLVERLSREKRDAEIARDLAEASTRAKSAFIANISHEIRTPLNALLGMTQLLERSELDLAQRSHVKVLLEAGRGLKTLLDDVIALSRDEGESEHAPDEDCDAAQAARTVARLMQPRSWEKQLRLTVTTAANLPRVAADPRRVRQVLLKLADNAVKFTQRGGVEISVSSGAREDGQPILRFEVADTGLGISPEIAANIFEPFLPGDNSYARHNDGAGLGLAVARRVITALGGAIGFSSEPGQGTTFWFEVPAVSNANVATPDPPAVTGDVAPPWGLSVLVWISDGPIRTKVVNMIEPFGNRVVIATNAAGAIGFAGREAFDVIIVGGEDADSMAAAPGVHVPLLALVWNGMRTPAAASQILRWPAGAGALYFALHDLLGRGADSGKAKSEAQHAGAMIDAPAFATLEKSLGITTLIEILQAYTKTAEDLCVSLDEAAHGESWDIAARVAQDIASSAGGLGLSALTAAARGFAQKARDGDDNLLLRRAAENVVNEHRRVRLALANLYPELAA